MKPVFFGNWNDVLKEIACMYDTESEEQTHLASIQNGKDYL
jgi:hypothetical protein